MTTAGVRETLARKRIARAGAMPKNIVVCCDGTSNEFDGARTNVVKLYQMLIARPEDPGNLLPSGLGHHGGGGRADRFLALVDEARGLCLRLRPQERHPRRLRLPDEPLRGGRPRLPLRLLARRLHRARGRLAPSSLRPHAHGQRAPRALRHPHDEAHQSAERAPQTERRRKRRRRIRSSSRSSSSRRSPLRPANPISSASGTL